MIKIVKALEDSDVLFKGVTKTLQNDVKKKWCFTNFTNDFGHFSSILIKWKRIISSRTRNI